MIILVSSLLLSGCSISTTVKPLTKQINEICIEKNDDILMDDFLPTIERTLDEIKISHKIDSNCDDVLKYTANWRWDLAMYLYYADFAIYEGQKKIAHAEYDATMGGARLDKFGTTENKIKPIIKKLFNR
ncbi:MAG: Sbal_3080 family lipoprotein [Candidatus Nitrosotenuis sp.]